MPVMIFEDGAFREVAEEPPASEWPSLALNRDRAAPYGWIQWKGTDVCMDVHCACGALLHVDADFCYFVQCPYCNQTYECSGFIDLIPVPPQPDAVRLQRDEDG
jgi:hypothetical protein